jgi:hypothetical protein
LTRLSEKRKLLILLLHGGLRGNRKEGGEAYY